MKRIAKRPSVILQSLALLIAFAAAHSSAYAGDNHSLYIKNNCSRPISVALHYLTLSQGWKTKGWYNFQPGEKAYVADTKNKYFYYYAHTNEHESFRLTWAGNGSYRYSVGNSSKLYSFKEERFFANSWIEYTQSFSCPNTSKYKAIVLATNPQGHWASRKHNTFTEAKNAAEAGCAGCRYLNGAQVDNRSPGCIAIASVPNTTRLFYGIGPNRTSAESNLFRGCSGQAVSCKLEHTACND